MYVDDNLNVFTFGKEYHVDEGVNVADCFFNNVLTTKSRYLYVFHEKSGYCQQRTLVNGLNDLCDFVVMKNKIIICHRDTMKVVEFMFSL